MNFLYFAHVPLVVVFFLFALGLALAHWRDILSQQSRDREGAVFHKAAQSTDPRRRGRT